MNYSAVFRFTGPMMMHVYQSVEAEQDDMGRSAVHLHMEGEETLVLRICADDLSALRAALNTWLRLINIAKEMQEIV
jgi:KEOPS complex subunit Pcc1